MMRKRNLPGGRQALVERIERMRTDFFGGMFCMRVEKMRTDFFYFIR